LTPATLAFTHHFADLPDPRIDRTKKHLLGDILVITLCAVIGGAESWPDIEQFGHSKRDWFGRFLALPNGIPSHDTFRRLFIALDPKQFAACFGRWMAALCTGCGLRPVAIDGKSARRSKKATATGCLHLVSAWAAENRLILGQEEVAEGSNEITAIPQLLRALDLKGALVTIDAAGCQVGIAEQIREQGGHYLLPVKGNQPHLEQACERVLSEAVAGDFAGLRYDQEAWVERGHGREEERYVTVVYDPEGLPAVWPDVKALVCVGRERSIKGKNSSDRQLYISSYAGRAKRMGGLVRGHWGIENSLHWVLDVVFREDDNRTHEGAAGANLGMLRRVATSLLKRARGKGSIHTKRLQAGWDNEFLLHVLGGITEE
jgi:predicted transposase YbfD/YdcC